MSGKMNMRPSTLVLRAKGLYVSKTLRITAMLVVVGIALILMASVASALMAGQGFLWTVAADAPVILDVCWQNPGDAAPLPGETNRTSGAQRREWVRRALKHSWERSARVIFVGWDECQDEAHAVPPPHTFGPRRPDPSDENLKILITSSGGGQNPGHGSWGDHQIDGIRLNLHSTCGGSLQTCIEFLSIHEFGHALGFYHGEERSDWPQIPGCPQQSYPPTYPWWPPPTELLYGEPDPDSIMSYCAGYVTELSPKDVAGVQAIYQRHLPGTLLNSAASLCLASHANQPNGEDAFGWACDEAYDDQEWHYDRTKEALYIQWPGAPGQNRRCLDVDTLDYTGVQTWDCHYGPNQQWQFRKVELRGYGNLCATRPRANAGNVVMQKCSGSSTQLWRVEPAIVPGSFRLRTETGAQCLAASHDSMSAVRVEPCYLQNPIFLPVLLSTASQQSFSSPPGPMTTTRTTADRVQHFYLNEGGQIRLPALFGRDDPYCLDVRNVWNHEYVEGKGGPAPGQIVQAFRCLDSQLNQRWNLTGDILSGGKCLSLTGSGTYNGSAARMESCNDSAKQDWDYYW